MAEPTLPALLPPVYRGGPSLTFKPQDVRIDRRTGLLKTTHGVSVDAEPEHVLSFGGVFLVRSVPAGLTIIQRGRRTSHYEIVPARPMTPDQFQALLDQVELEQFHEDD